LLIAELYYTLGLILYEFAGLIQGFALTAIAEWQWWGKVLPVGF